ncbi:MAG: type II toxin-antitoxin system VapC family toxin [Bacteroidota bacterium]
MGEVVLDTNAIIHFFKGDRSIQELLKSFSTWYLPTTVVGELLFGAYNSTHVEKNLATYRSFFDQVIILSPNDEIVVSYAQIRLELKRIGKPIPENDIWIAATAKAKGLPLATLDKHFSSIKNLELSK